MVARGVDVGRMPEIDEKERKLGMRAGIVGNQSKWTILQMMFDSYWNRSENKFPKDILFNRMKCKDISINITIWEIVAYEDKVANNFVSGTF